MSPSRNLLPRLCCLSVIEISSQSATGIFPGAGHRRDSFICLLRSQGQSALVPCGKAAAVSRVLCFSSSRTAPRFWSLSEALFSGPMFIPLLSSAFFPVDPNLPWGQNYKWTQSSREGVTKPLETGAIVPPGCWFFWPGTTEAEWTLPGWDAIFLRYFLQFLTFT